jgi:hypothetical protein
MARRRSTKLELPPGDWIVHADRRHVFLRHFGFLPMGLLPLLFIPNAAPSTLCGTYVLAIRDSRWLFRLKVGAMEDCQFPSGYILFSEAIHRLEMSMWGNRPRAIALQQFKQELRKCGEQKLRVGFGPWRQRAGRCLTQAAVNGTLAVYVAHQEEGSPICALVPPRVVKRLILSRGYLRDRAIRPSLKAFKGDEALFKLLGTGLLVVAESEFCQWKEAEYNKGRWPSQRSRSKRGEGRPTKQTESLRNAVLARVHDGVWRGTQSINSLRRLLIDSGRDDVPSADTLARLIDKMHEETGDPALRRVKRAGRHATK